MDLLKDFQKVRITGSLLIKQWI